MELAYTYLVAWYVIHCSTLMTTPTKAKKPVLYLQRLKSCIRKNLCLFYFLSILHQETSYIICPCRLELSASRYAVDLVDTQCRGGYTTLSAEAFLWLVSIHPRYLAFWQNDHYVIEPYMSSRFACKLGYDQLYVGNHNLDLEYSVSMFDDARA